MDLSHPDDSYLGSDLSYPLSTSSYPTLWTIRTQQIMTQNVQNKQTFTPFILVIIMCRVRIVQRVGYELVESGYETTGTQNVTYLHFFAVIIIVAFIDSIVTLPPLSSPLEKTENPSTAGYILRENRTLKPHDFSIIKLNLNQMEQVENFVQGIEDSVKRDLQSSILINGKIKAGRRTSYKFGEDVRNF